MSDFCLFGFICDLDNYEVIFNYFGGYYRYFKKNYIIKYLNEHLRPTH